MFIKKHRSYYCIIFITGLALSALGPVSAFSAVQSYTSRIVINPSTPADGTSACTAVVIVNDENGNPIPGKTVNFSTTRGSSFDTIIYRFGTSTDANGQCTVTILSPYVGPDTVSATADAVTISPNLVSNPSFEAGSGGMPYNWTGVGINGSPAFAQASDAWSNGSKSASISLSATLGDVGYWKSDPFQVSPNTVYRLTFFYKYKNSTMSSGLAKIADYSVSWELSNSTSWKFFDQIFTTTSSPAAFIHLELGPETNQKIWFDDVVLTRTPATNFNAMLLKFVSNPQINLDAAPKDGPSKPIRVAAQGDAGNTDEYFTEPITLSASSGTGLFSATATPWSSVTQISPVSGVATFYYKDSVIGNYTITASRTGMASDAQQIQVSSGPVKLDLGTSFVGTAGNAVSLTIVSRDADNNAVSYTGDVSIASNSSNGFFSADGGASWSKTAVVNFPGVQSKQVSYRDDRVGNPVVTVTSSDIGSTTALGTISVSSVSAYASYLLVNPVSIIANGTSNCSVAVRVLDDYGNPVSGKNPSIAATIGSVTNPPASGADGWCTGSIASLNSGNENTITAAVDAAGIVNNLVYNPSFEYGNYDSTTNPAGWASFADSGSPVMKWARPVTGYAYSGGKSVYIFAPGAADEGKWKSDAIAVEQGRVYTIEAWHKSSTSSGNILIKVDTGNSWYTSASTSWKQLWKSFIAAGTSVSIELDLTGVAGGKTTWFDGIRLQRTPIAVFTASQLVITSPVRAAKAGVPTDSITVEARDGNNNIDPNFNGTVNLSSNSGAGLFSAAKVPWSSMSALALSSGSGQFYYKDSTPGSPTITVSYAGLQSGSQTESIRYGAIKLKIVSAVRNPRAGSASAAIAIEAQTETGGADPNFNETVTLATTGNSGQFSTNLSTWSSYGANTYVQLVAGIKSVYYRDFNLGEPVITVSHWDLTPDSQTEQIRVSRFVITSAQKTVKAGMPTDALSVEAQDENGHKDPTFNDYANLGTSSGTGTFSANQSPWINAATISIASGQGSFYYKDNATGLPLVSVSRADLGMTSGTQNETIIFGAIKLKITSAAVPERAGWPAMLSVQAQTNTGAMDTAVSDVANLVSTSLDGHFSLSSTGWSDVAQVTLDMGQATFYYLDHITGSPVVTVSNSGLTPDSQTRSIIYGAINFNISTPSRTVKAGLASEAITAQALTDTGDIDLTFNGYAVLSSSSNSGSFSASATQWSNTTSLRFSSGSGSFYYKDRTTGEPTVSIGASGFNTATQGQFVIYGAISLGFASAQRSARAGFPTDAVSISALTDTGDIDVSDYGTVLLSSSSSSGSFSLSGTQWSDINQVDLAAGQASFYYKDSKTGYPTVTASRSGLISGAQKETITFGAIRFVMTNAQRTAKAGAITDIVQVEARTNSGAVDLSFSGTASLLTTSNTGFFSASATQWADTNVIVFSAGRSSFYYRDGKTGLPLVTVTRPDFYAGGQQETITYGAIRLAITTPGRTVKAGVASPAVTVRALTNTGALDISVNGTVALATSSSSGVFSADPSQWQDTALITLSGGQASFYYKDRLTGMPSITVSRENADLAQAVQGETVIYGAIKMRISTSPPALASGTPYPVRVEALTDTDDLDKGYNGQVAFWSYSSLNSGEFSFDSASWSPITLGGNFNAGETVIYFTDRNFETGAIEAVSPEFASDSQEFVVTVSRLKIITPSRSTKAGYPTDYITAVATDENNNIDYAYSGTITLSTTSSTGAFSVSRFSWKNTTAVMMENGSATFYYRDNAVGAPFVTVSRQGLIPDAQAQDIQFGASRLVIITPQRSVKAGAVTDSIVIEAQTITGILDVSIDGHTVYLSSSTSQESYAFSDSSSWNTITSVVLSSGTAAVFYKDLRTGQAFITVSVDTQVVELLPATQVETITGGAVRLKITTSGKTARAGDVTSIMTVQAQTCTGALDITWPAGSTVTFSTSSNSGLFSLNGSPPWYPSGCTFTVVAGNRNFYYIDYSMGMPSITVSRHNNDLYADYQGETITSSRLRITSQGYTTVAGIPTDTITVEAQDENMNFDPTFSGTVSLSSSSDSKAFSISRTSWADATIINIRNGRSAFFYKDHRSGMPLITISNPVLRSDSQTETVTLAAIKLKFVTPVRTTKSGSPTGEVTIWAATDTDQLDASVNCTVSLVSTFGSSGAFSANYSQWSDTNLITLTGGQATVFFKSKKKTGQATMGAYAAGLFSDSQAVNIVYGAIKIKITSDSQTITPYSASDPVVAQALTDTNALDKNFTETIVWTTDDGANGNFNTQQLPIEDPSWVNTGSIQVKMVQGQSTIYYKDIAIGTKTLTVDKWDYSMPSDTQTIRVQMGIPRIMNALSTPFWLSPNGDSLRDTVSVSYYLKDDDNASDWVTAYIFDSSHNMVGTLVNTQPRPTNTYSYEVWAPVAGSLVEDTYYAWIDAYDATGLKASDYAYTDTCDIAVDLAGPYTGSVAINNGAQYADNLSVVLNLSSDDTLSGVGEILASNDPGFAAALILAYSANVTWTLAGNNTQTVYVKFLDLARNPSFTCTATVFIDTGPPRIAWTSPASGESDVYYKNDITAQFTKRMDQATVNTGTIKMSYVVGVTTYFVTGTLTYNPVTFRILFDPSIDLEFLRTYTMEVKGGVTGVKDIYGTPMTGNYAWSFTVGVVDDTPPLGWIKINSNASYTNTSVVTLSLYAFDTHGYVATVWIGDSPGVGTSINCESNPYTGVIPWILKGLNPGESDAVRTVYAWYDDADGNRSQICSDNIILDTVTPSPIAGPQEVPGNRIKTKDDIRITFNDLMDTNSFVYLQPGGSVYIQYFDPPYDLVPARLRFETVLHPDGITWVTVAVIDPDTLLTPNTEYAVSITNGVADKAGNYYNAPGYIWYVMTDTASNTVRPGSISSLRFAPTGPSTGRLVWDPVLKNEDGSAYTDTKSYLVFRSQTSGTSYTQVAEINGSETSYNDSGILAGQAYYWAVAAKSSWDITGFLSEEIDRYGGLRIMLPGETQTYIALPRNAVAMLDNPESKTVYITVTRDGIMPPDATGFGRIVGIFDFLPRRISDNAAVEFSISPNTLTITLHYVAPGGLIENTDYSSLDAARYLSVAYWDGHKWVKLSGTLDLVNQSISFTTTHLSRFAIMALDITAFKVISAEPNPFTPLNPPFDKVTFSFTNPDKEDVVLRVFDITGTQFYIKEYTSGEVSVTWDGKDVNGTVGEDGVYVYQVQVGTQFYTGTIILAK